MKLGVLVLCASLACNVIAVGLLARRPPPALEALRRAVRTTAEREAEDRAERGRREQAAAAQRQRNAARLALTWSAIATDDLRALVANLRAAGFPPELVRAIIGARINARAGRHWQDVERAEQDRPFWKAPVKETPQQIAAWGEIIRERTQAFRDLLGDEADREAEPRSDYQRWQFGELTPAKIDLVERINADYQDLTRQIETLMEDVTLPEDRAALALLQREKRADLARVLSPEELADYELRRSRTTGALRGALTLMNATESEFRAIYPLQQKFEERFSTPDYDGDNWEQRNEAQIQMVAEVRRVLGEARGADFARAADYGFQEIARVVERENLAPEVATRTYDLRNRTAEESVRIIDDRTMTYDQKVEAMRTLAAAAKSQLSGLLGPAAADAYGSSAAWVKAISNGSGVRFKGATTSFPHIPRTPPATPGAP